MKTEAIFKSMILWGFILILLFLVAGLNVMPAQSKDLSVVTFFVQ